MTFGQHSTAIGASAESGSWATAIGYSAEAGYSGVAIGANASAAEGATAIRSNADGAFSTAIGGATVSAPASRGVAIGQASQVTAAGGAALGANASVSVAGGVAIGEGSTATGVGLNAAAFLTGGTATSEVAFGGRRLRGIAAGALPTDAANVGQLDALGQGIVNWFGGGAMMTSTGFTAPTFHVQGGSYSTVYDAFSAIDTQLTGIKDDIATIELTPGPTGPQGPQGPSGANGTDGASGTGSQLAVEYDTTDRSQVTLNAGGQATTVTNVADGVGNRDAVNVQQLRRETTQAVSTANAYTDRRINEVSQLWDDRWDAVQGQLSDLGSQMERMGAMNAALTMMVGSSADGPGPVSAQMGVGFYGARSAIAVGLKARLSERSALTMGLSHDGRKALGGMGLSINLD